MSEQTTQLQTLTDAELAELLKLAGKATPGPWYSTGRLSEEETCGRPQDPRIVRPMPGEDPEVQDVLELGREKDFDFIAAANPATVSALVSDYMRLRGIVAKLPVTKDGVPITPGMPLYVNGYPYCGSASLIFGIDDYESGYYSTRAAADAALASQQEGAVQR